MNTYIPRLMRVIFSLLIYPTIGAADVPANGKLSLTLIPRFESVQQTGRQSASALTLGTNLGYTHAVNEQFSFSVEVEDTRAADEDSYNPAGLNPRSTNRAVVADPTGAEINQAWVSYQDDIFAAKIGRQALVLNNARFIGNVGWRQNMQTFDAIQATATSAPLKFTCAYLNQINRILGDDHPAGQWDSDCHLLNLDWKITEGLQLFVKTGCPWCAHATDVLNRAGHKYQEINVTNDSDAWDQMKTLSGQTKAPVLDWNGDVLADFGTEELVPFLKARGLAVPA